MKVRIYPATEDVKSLLSGRIQALRSDLDITQAELDRLNAPSALWHSDTAKLSLEANRARITAAIDELQTQVGLLVSHGKPECLVEIEL